MNSTTIGVYKYKWSLSIGYTYDRTDDFTVGDMGFDEDEWDAGTEEQRRSALKEYSEDSANEYVEISWSPAN